MQIVDVISGQLDDGTWKVWFKAVYEGYVYTDSLYYPDTPDPLVVQAEAQQRADDWYAFVTNPPPPTELAVPGVVDG